MIKNGKDSLLSLNSGTLPDVSGGMLEWFQKITIGKIVKEVVNYMLQETITTINFYGVWQPMSAKSLEMKPEGQRQWKWITLHCDTSLLLSNDDIITYNDEKYRVMSKQDYSSYGYLEYSLVDNYEAA